MPLAEYEQRTSWPRTWQLILVSIWAMYALVIVVIAGFALFDGLGLLIEFGFYFVGLSVVIIMLYSIAGVRIENIDRRWHLFTGDIAQVEAYSDDPVGWVWIRFEHDGNRRMRVSPNHYKSYAKTLRQDAQNVTVVRRLIGSDVPPIYEMFVYRP